jgi:hypothetical protein
VIGRINSSTFIYGKASLTYINRSKTPQKRHDKTSITSNNRKRC